MSDGRRIYLIADGRLVLGMGAGWNESEFRAFGVPFDHRITRFEEAFTIIRSLLRDGAVDFAGTYYEARDCELLPRGPRAGGEMHVVLVDNGRSERLGLEEFWTSLKCIRCGACMNTCPVYRRSGGYSYESTVPGPIASTASKITG